MAYVTDGIHIIGDLFFCEGELNDFGKIKSFMVLAARSAGANVFKTIGKKFKPKGVTILVGISESHLSVHTYPNNEENMRVHFDIFTCGDSMRPEEALISIISFFRPKRACCTKLIRGARPGASMVVQIEINGLAIEPYHVLLETYNAMGFDNVHASATAVQGDWTPDRAHLSHLPGPTRADRKLPALLGGK